MQLPREVIVGKGTLDRIPEVVNRLGLKGKALVLSDAQCYKIAGEKVSAELEKAGLTPDFLLVKSMTVDDLILVEKQLKEQKPRVVFGVGGGTIIDAAKLSSASQNLPFISIPTTVSHDGIASPLASIKGSEKPYSVLAQAPMAIIADIEIISQGPMALCHKRLRRRNLQIHRSKRLETGISRKRRILRRIRSKFSVDECQIGYCKR